MFFKSAAVVASALSLLSFQAAQVSAQAVSALAPIEIPREGWVILSDSNQPGNEPGNALDNNPGTIWHTAWGPDAPMPHWIAIDMGNQYVVNGYSYTPRQDKDNNGNVGEHRIEVSMDAQNWIPVAQGTWANDKTVKTTLFTPIVARYVSMVVTSEAAGVGNQWASAAEINILTNPHASLPRANWAVSADSFEQATQNYGPQYAIDSSPGTFWHTQYNGGNPGLPHFFTINTNNGQTRCGGISYTPRPAGTGPNGRIGQYQVQYSTNGGNWVTVATGTWADTVTQKFAEWDPVTAQYWRLVALSEAGNRGGFTSAAEINLLDGANNMANWIVTVSSQETQAVNNSAVNAFDSDLTTMWHTRYTGGFAPFPHYFQIDMQATLPVKALQYTPRQDGEANGRIGNYRIEISLNGASWTTVSTGQFADNAQAKLVQFQEQNARYVRLTATSEAGNRGSFASAAEIVLQYDSSYTAPNPKTFGQWGLTVDFPVVPVAVALTWNTGSVLAWSSWNEAGFDGFSGGQTLTALYNPGSGGVSKALVTNTGHDMFCPGISMDFNGRIIVTGGNNAEKTSIYRPDAGNWIGAPNMQQPRGYQSSTTLSNGNMFTIGGSWSGGIYLKNGEVYNTNNNQWNMINGANVQPMLTNDYAGLYRSDNHAMMFAWKNAAVFHAGPSKAMLWYTTTGNGGVQGAGQRGDAPDQMCGIAAMYDAVAGKILVAGGSVDYSGSAAVANSYVITIGNVGAQAQVQKTPNMAFKRIYHNGVILPNGQVYVAGGQDVGSPFNDDSSIMYGELFTPNSGGGTWATMAPYTVPRNYHSVGLLLTDGTVMIGGGGLCNGCDYNHYDGQVWRPPYLFTSSGGVATRPVINSVSTTTVRIGQQITANMNSAVTSFALVRMGSATHTVNTDQRRIPLTPTANGNSYTVTVPNDAGVALPGYWMLFAMNSAGVPSVARIIKVTL